MAYKPADMPYWSQDWVEVWAEDWNREDKQLADKQGSVSKGAATEAQCPPSLAKQILDKADEDDLRWYGYIEYNDRFSVRFGDDVDFIEGLNLIFIGENTTVKVPKVYAMFSHDDFSFIITERIGDESDAMSERWGDLTDQDIERVTEQLGCYVKELRKLSPPGYIGNLNGTSMTDSIMNGKIGEWGGAKNRGQPIKAFDSQEVMVEAYLNKFDKAGAKFADREAILETLNRDKTAVFTHGELSPVNLKWVNGELVVLNWRYAGWRPRFWEFCCSMSVIEDSFDSWMKDGWRQVLKDAVGDCPDEWQQIKELLDGLN